ncbi:SCO1664 family protein [soil metagenome]
MSDVSRQRGQHWRAETPVTTSQELVALSEGRLEAVGRLVEASNATLYCELTPPDGLLPDGTEGGLHAIYKPVRGERPLADFPDGTLAQRELAAWLVSEATGWAIVPPTVIRDGPFGRGMVQLWVDADPDVDLIALVLLRDTRLRQMALLDAAMNNADRKASHILPTVDGDLHGCDHGICFASEPKLRTVLWGWAGEPISGPERAALVRLEAALAGELAERLDEQLSRAEVEALRERAARLVNEGRFPLPDRDRRVIPWPPF